MNFVVIGAGAIGCYVGARLAHAGHHVVFVGRPRVLEPLRRQGLRVSDVQGFDAHLSPAALCLCESLAQALAALPAGQGAPTLLVCVKGTATRDVARDIAHSAAAGTVVLSLQNGVGNVDRIRALAPQVLVHAGMVPYTVMWCDPQHVRRVNRGVLQVEHSAHSQALQAPMGTAGVAIELQDHMPAVLWGKLLLNLLNPVNALADLPIREQLLQRDHRLVLAALQTEALQVLRAAGIRPAKVAAAAPRMVPRILRLPNWLFTRVAAGMLRLDPQARTSMCADLQSGRCTEIDDLCGEVVRLAQQHQVPAPLNRAMVELIAQHAPGTRWSGAALRQQLGLD